ncbi:uncharacterized protein LOC142985300 isoform X3 [Anticarsia gemmatalis]|uniref:uncharacterized protein LOC142985300 isoform X3 n=1 Tax=Anticarsia gemmatalis TaxID=129554 RepID=UPI003F76B59F
MKCAPLRTWKIKAPWGQLSLTSWGNPNSPPVFLVHGRQDCAATFQPLLQLLPQEYYFVAIDMPGSGPSDPLPNEMEYQEEIEEKPPESESAEDRGGTSEDKEDEAVENTCNTITSPILLDWQKELFITIPDISDGADANGNLPWNIVPNSNIIDSIPALDISSAENLDSGLESITNTDDWFDQETISSFIGIGLLNPILIEDSQSDATLSPRQLMSEQNIFGGEGPISKWISTGSLYVFFVASY